MKRLAGLLVLALLAAGCVSQQDASTAAIRVLNAVPDGPPIDIYVDGILQLRGLDYGGGTPFLAPAAGARQVRLDQRQPSDADPDFVTIYDQSESLAVNDELSLVLLGSVAAGNVQVVSVRTTTRGVPTGQTRTQFIHAAVGGAPVDVYVTAPGAGVAGSTPFASSLAYASATPQQEVSSGGAAIVLTEAGNPANVLFDSGTVFLTLEGTLLIAILQNTGLDAAVRPYVLTILTGTTSGRTLDEGTQANLRFANVSPGSYGLDLFLNSSATDDTARQVCDPGTAEEGTTLEICAVAFGSATAYSSFEPAGYDLKLQVTGNDALPAQSFSRSYLPGAEGTFLPLGLVADGATTMGLTALDLLGGRRIATAGQLRIVDASLAADAAISGDPTTDRLELYISDPAVALADDSPDFTTFRIGFDTGLVSLTPGTWRVTLAKTDTAVTDAVPEALFTRDVALAAGGLYTLVIADSVGGVLPLQSFSLDDDPTPAP